MSPIFILNENIANLTEKQFYFVANLKDFDTDTQHHKINLRNIFYKCYCAVWFKGFLNL